MQKQVPRAPRVPLPIPIMYGRTGEETWFQSTVVNLSESGVLVGPAELQPGALLLGEETSHRCFLNWQPSWSM
jgi:hypothetical protein